MGHLLATPITVKDTEGGRGNGLEFGLATMQGWRVSMEDAHVAALNPVGLPKGCSLFAVFDGHGGQLAATLASKSITKELENVMKTVFVDGKVDGADSCKIRNAMREAFMNLDQTIRNTFEQQNDLSGSTAIVALITPTRIIVANSGDSRSVMGRAGHTVHMSFDHKPKNVDERARIVNAGGSVWDNRVNGDLSVSRALGDFRYKSRADLPAEQQQVSAVPDVIVKEIDEMVEFLVLACDGIWDVMSNDEICAYIRELMNQGETDLKLIAEAILDKCFAAGSRDNMSVVIVKFPGAKVGQGGGVAAIREKKKACTEKALQETAKGT